MNVPVVSATRRNHAIEHATIAILFRRRGQVIGNVAARSDHRGFFLRGPFSVEEVQSAADEALARLRAGESHLARTHLCGTNLAVTAMAAGAAAIAGAGFGKQRNWSLGLLMATGATLLAPRAGLALQRLATTDADVGETRITAVREVRAGSPTTRHIRVSLGTP